MKITILRVQLVLLAVAVALAVMPVQGANKKEQYGPPGGGRPAVQPDANKKEAPGFFAWVKGWIVPAANKKE
jgi:hypothetical protein